MLRWRENFLRKNSKFVQHFCARNRRDVINKDETQEVGDSVYNGFLNPAKL